jgi:signal peptidase I
MSDPYFRDPTPLEQSLSEPTKQRNPLLKFLGELLQTALLAVLLFAAVNLVTARIRVEGISMEPSLYDGQFVVVNKLSYRWQDPIRGDIVVFHYPLEPNRRFIKRVIGLPGDIVNIHSGEIFVNDTIVDEPYIAEDPTYDGEWRLGPNEVFVLGDNRNWSSDSHKWGPLPIEEIIGKAVLVYWPLDTVGLIPHYDLVGASSVNN